MYTRGQRFVFVLQLHDQKCWHSSEGHAYKQFVAWGFDVSLVEESDFLREDIRPSGRVAGDAPTRQTTYSISNKSFHLKLIYTIQHFNNIVSENTVSEKSYITINLVCSVDDQNAFDYWLDEKIYQRQLNLCTPDQTVDRGTEFREIRLPLQDGVARYVAKPDGSSEFSMPGKRLSIMPDSQANVQMNQIDKIRIDNLLDLKSYSITRYDNRTFHIFEYISGKIGEITYGPSGELEVFHVQGPLAIADREITLFESKIQKH